MRTLNSARLEELFRMSEGVCPRLIPANQHSYEQSGNLDCGWGRLMQGWAAFRKVHDIEFSPRGHSSRVFPSNVACKRFVLDLVRKVFGGTMTQRQAWRLAVRVIALNDQAERPEEAWKTIKACLRAACAPKVSLPQSPQPAAARRHRYAVSC